MTDSLLFLQLSVIKSLRLAMPKPYLQNLPMFHEIVTVSVQPTAFRTGWLTC